jgi:phage N-6-adenine-methyltransferase
MPNLQDVSNILKDVYINAIRKQLDGNDGYFKMKGQDKLFSSKSDEWRTPLNKWLEWNEEFGPFTFDAAANENNHLCDVWSGDSLDVSWDGKVWCNPPYSRVGEFVQKAYKERLLNDKCEVIVMLIPARTDTKWFHTYCYNQYGVEIRFLKGRLKFLDENGEAKNSAPFPSMLVIFR